MNDDTFQPAIDLTQFNTLGFAAGDIATLCMYLILAAYVIYTAIFYYHWQQYGTGGTVITLTFIAYAVITLPLAVIILTLGLTL